MAAGGVRAGNRFVVINPTMDGAFIAFTVYRQTSIHLTSNCFTCEDIMQTINVDTLRTWLDTGRPVAVLDVRTVADRAEWAIPGSIHVDAYAALKTNDPHALDAVDLPGDMPVVTVCGAGKISLVAAEQLRGRGLEVYSLAGGMQAWSLAWNTAELLLPNSAAHVVQVRRTGKGCLSYLIGADGEAAVIDAALETAIYQQLAEQHGWRITAVLDTHIHADHLSRSRALAEQIGATLYLPDQQRASFAHSRSVTTTPSLSAMHGSSPCGRRGTRRRAPATCSTARRSSPVIRCS
jgi:rhodanese-related sulfurtransferase